MYAGMDDRELVIMRTSRWQYWPSTMLQRRLTANASEASGSGETVRENYNRIQGLYKRWMRPKTKTKDQMDKTTILEQYLWMLWPDVRVWVNENQPLTGEEVARLAERYVEPHREPPRTNKGTVGKGKIKESSVNTAGLAGKVYCCCGALA
ncbi:hypothetical protein QQF64_006198 [Cirrhinus molitorella]|uniref:SCAN box domain-containing protein n=1 Tax=Cirrhinus molitorella TaxID=172907 RepID=A0ABR3MHH0_9TELE